MSTDPRNEVNLASRHFRKVNFFILGIINLVEKLRARPAQREVKGESDETLDGTLAEPQKVGLTLRSLIL